MSDNKEPVYIKDLFEDNFFNNWIDFTLNFNEYEYSKKIKVGIENVIHREENNQDYDSVYDINTLNKSHILSFTDYTKAIYNFPILIHLAIDILILNQIIRENEHIECSNSYLTFKINSQDYVKKILKNQINNLKNTNIHIFEDYYTYLDFSINRSLKPPVIQYKILSYLISTATNSISTIKHNLIKDIDIIIKSYSLYDIPYLTIVKEDIKKNLKDSKRAYIKKNLTDRNMNSQWGGKEKINIEQINLLKDAKIKYYKSLKILNKVNFLKKFYSHKTNEKICKKIVLRNLEKKSLGEKEYTGYKIDIEEIFCCEKTGEESKTCTYLLPNDICNKLSYIQKWNILEFIKNNYHLLHQYLTFYQGINTTEDLLDFLEKKTATEISYMFITQKSEIVLKGITFGNDTEIKKINNKKFKTIQNLFSELDEIESKISANYDEFIPNEHLLLLYDIEFALCGDFYFLGNENSKKKLYELINKITNVK